jgi:hypothetical protein
MSVLPQRAPGPTVTRGAGMRTALSAARVSHARPVREGVQGQRTNKLHLCRSRTNRIETTPDTLRGCPAARAGSAPPAAAAAPAPVET